MKQPGIGMVKTTINYRIVKTLIDNHGRWMTSAEINTAIGANNARQIGQKLKYIVTECSEIEQMSEGRVHRYRYVGDCSGTIMVPSKRVTRVTV